MPSGLHSAEKKLLIRRAVSVELEGKREGGSTRCGYNQQPDENENEKAPDSHTEQSPSQGIGALTDPAIEADHGIRIIPCLRCGSRADTAEPGSDLLER